MSEPGNDDLEPAQALAAWLASRPPAVQKLAAEFPFASEMEFDDGVVLFVIGWTDDDMVVVSETPPDQMYGHGEEAFEKAYAARQYICADHLRATEIANDETTPTEPDAA